MDLNGFPKTAYYINQVQWIKDRPLIYIALHCNTRGSEGQPIEVMVIANVEQIKLLLNGCALGEQKVAPYRMNSFEVPYAPGKLEAIGYRGGVEVARATVETTGETVALELIPDRPSLAGDGRDAMQITARALDAAGRAVPIDDSLVSFEVNGAGQSIGHGNGDPSSHEDEKGKTRRLFNGLAQLLGQSRHESDGVLSTCWPVVDHGQLARHAATRAQPHARGVAGAPPAIDPRRTLGLDLKLRPDPASVIDATC